MRSSVPRVRVKAVDIARLAAVNRNAAHGLPCLYCWAPMEVPTWDHVVPRASGGTNARGNLLVVCLACNQRKANRNLAEYEGHLLALGDPRSRIVAILSTWVMRGWPEDQRALWRRALTKEWSKTNQRLRAMRRVRHGFGAEAPRIDRRA